MSQVEDLYELSPMQQGMLFQTLREPDTEGLYLLQLDSAMRGPLDAEALAQAWQRAVDHHPALRTSIHFGNDRPLQVVHRQARIARLSQPRRAPVRQAVAPAAPANKTVEITRGVETKDYEVGGYAH